MPQTIAEHEVERGYLPQGGSGLKEGEAVSATRKGLVFEYAQDGGYIAGEIRVPWADVLKHAPITAVIESLRGRPGVEIEDIGDAWHEFNITSPTTVIFIKKDGAQ